MSHSLMIYIDENIKFDPDVTMKAISNIDNADLGLFEGEFSEGFGRYRFEDDDTGINIGKGWDFIAVESVGKAALNFAFNLQQLLNIDLTVTDTDYSFLCKLKQVSSLEEFENIVAQSIHMNEK